MEYKGVKHYQPDWEMDAQFLLLDLHPVMDLDATLHSHPIIQAASHPEQIYEMFDKISYKKGASILRMLENFTGPEQFRNGVNLFLDQYKYKNAVTDDLWKALEDVSQEQLPIKQMMDTWTRQMGYPVLHVEDLGQGKLTIRQERYLNNGHKNKENVANFKWDVPLTWITSETNKTRIQMFGQTENKLRITVPKTASWVKFNVGQVGYYRVNYPSKYWTNFIGLLGTHHTIFSPMDRASLLNDAFALAESGHITYTVPLTMAEYLIHETHLVPIKTAFRKLSDIESLLKNMDTIGLFRSYLESILEQMYTRVGWTDQGTHVEKLTRSYVLEKACKNGHSHCSKQAGELLLQWIDNVSFPIPANLRSTVYKYGMAAVGTEEIWGTMLHRFRAEKKADEKLRLIKGVANIRNEKVVEKFIKMATNGTVIRVQDLHYTMMAIHHNPIGSKIVSKFVRTNWEKVDNLFSGKQRRLNQLVKSLVAAFTTQKELKEVKEIFKKYPAKREKSRTREQTIEKINYNIDWQAKHFLDIKTFLERRGTSDNSTP